VLRGILVKISGDKGAVVRLFNNIHGLIPVRRLAREYKDIDTALDKMLPFYYRRQSKQS